MDSSSSDDDDFNMEVDLDDEDLFDQDFLYDGGVGKNYDMVLQLIRDAGSDYVEGRGQTKLEYYLDNLMKADSLKTFIDDENHGLLSTSFYLLNKKFLNKKFEAIQLYILGHRNIDLLDDNLVIAAAGNENVFFKLIEGGCNVHHKFSVTKMTPLHYATAFERKNIIKYLLDQNVDVNCCDWKACTPLHHAFIENISPDIFELLIQKGADLYLRNSEALTPLGYGIKFKRFDNVIFVLNSTLTENIINFDLLKELLFLFCLLHRENSQEFRGDPFRYRKSQKIMSYYTFFVLLCQKLFRYFIAKSNTRELPVLSIYLYNNIFESKDWAKALTIILTSNIAPILLDECLSYERESIFALVIPKLTLVGVEKVDRIELFKLLLLLKMKPDLKDMTLILRNYRFNEEFKLLSSYLREDSLINNYNKENSMEYIASVFCGLEDDLDYNLIFGKELSKEFYDYIKQYFTPALSNCSSYYHNNEENIPKILSLRELSRNSARKFIRNSKIISPGGFSSAVCSLSIPVMCKDYILLETKVDKLLD